MYRCTKCSQLSKPGEPATIVVVETRVKSYPRREQAMRRGSGATMRWIEDPGGTGVEIVREEIRHEGCV